MLEAMVLGVHIKSKAKREGGGWNMDGGKAESFFWGSGA